KTHHAHTHFTTARVRVRKINKPISAELRMQRYAHQTAFARLLNIRNDEQRLRFQRAVLDYTDTPGTLSDDHSSIRRPHDGPWHLESTNNLLDLKTYSCLRGRRLATRETQRYQQRY